MKRIIFIICIFNVGSWLFAQNHEFGEVPLPPSLLLMSDSTVSSMKIEQNDQGDYRATARLVEYKYSLYRLQDGTQTPCLIKSVKDVVEWFFHASHESSHQVTLTIYPDYDQKSAFSYTKPMQFFEQREDYFFAANYGCCDNPTYYELSTFPDNKTFLTCNKRYYVISIPGTNKSVYIGYLINNDSITKAEGVLGYLCYSMNKMEMQQIPIRLSNPHETIAKNYKLELFSHDRNDIVNSQSDDFDFMYAISLKDELAIRRYKNIGVRMTFYRDDKTQNRVESVYELEFKKGRLLPEEIWVSFSK